MTFLEQVQNLARTLIHGRLFRRNIEKREKAVEGAGAPPFFEVDPLRLAFFPTLPGVTHRVMR